MATTRSNFLVSVVIPAYNCAAYLPAAIESALDQTHPQVEVIVVNDGSPDDTDEVIQPYLDRIIYIHQENHGLSAARNAGFRASQGEFLCFLDADDMLMPDKFERQLEVFVRDPELGVVISGYIDVEEDGETTIQTVRKEWRHDALERMLRHEVFPPHTALIWRKVLEASPLFPEDIDTAESQEDWQLWLNLALDGVQFSSAPEPLCKYRHRAGSIRANPLKHLDGARRVVNWLRGDPRARPYHRQVERLAAIVEMERAAAAWRTDQPELFGEILAQAVKAQPSYWREPGVILRWFTSSLKMNEFVQWRLSPDMIVFEKQIAEMLSQAENILSTSRHRSLKAAAALALSDLAYGQQDTRIRHRALNAAIRNSWQVCLSPQGRASAARGLLGPILAGKLAAFYRSLRG